MKKKFTVVDLFAGAGGLSEGFQRKNFNIITYIEKNKYACHTLRIRHIYWHLIRNNQKRIYQDFLLGRIPAKNYFSIIPNNPIINKEITSDNIKEITNLINMMMNNQKIKKINIFIGGPPCQAYSLVGRSRDANKMQNDSRNNLYKHYLELVKIYKPEIFVFENVPGLLSAKKGQLLNNIKYSFSKEGYNINSILMIASNFLVPEKRKRVIIIGIKKIIKSELQEFHIKNHTFQINDLFKDLPPLQAGKKIEKGNYLSKPTKFLKITKIRTYEKILLHHITRPVNKVDKEIYKKVIELWNKSGKRLKYPDLPFRLKTHKNQTSFLDRFKVVAGNLPYSHTVVAHIAKDGHYYIHPDINQLRSISIREAARLQSFPDDYFFSGPRTAKLRQIGNAVPPLMAEIIAEKILELLS